MNKYILLVLLAVVALGGCSGRTDESTSETSDTASGANGATPSIGAAQAAPAQVLILSDKPTLQTGAADKAEITALVTDDSNRVVVGQDVLFSSDGGVLQDIVATTDESGEAKAFLNLAGDYRNRNITVSAEIGEFSASVLVAATGTKLDIETPDNLVTGQDANVTFTLVAGDGQPIPNRVITLSSAVGNTFSENAIVTDAAGMARVTVGTAAGSDTLTATTLDGSVSQGFPLGLVDDTSNQSVPVLIRVISNESAIETGGNDTARITALVTDESNRVIAGKEVEFSSTGGVLQNISAVTNDAGQATAELSLAGDYRNQEITVTVRVDEEEGNVLLTTSGSSLSVAGATALVSGMTADLEITLRGGNDQPIANELISISSLAGNTTSLGTTKTDSSGKAIVTIGSTAGDDVITVSALNGTVEVSHAINVADDLLTVLSPQGFDALHVDSFWPLQVEWESGGSPVVGEDIKFSITAGVVRALGDTGPGSSTAFVTTDASGVATIEIKSNSAGPATVAFADAIDADPFSQFDVEFVAFDVTQLDIAAAPASVATGNPSTVTAIVTDDFGNPVKDVVVEFSSPDLKGGRLSPVTAVTDSDGNASITFTAGSLSTQIDEIEIVASASDNSSVSDSIRMTVTERQLNAIIGLAGTLTEADSDTRYRKAGFVQVTDGAGRPVPDATILVTLIPTIYRYGVMVPVDSDGDGENDSWGRAREYIPGITDQQADYREFEYSYSCVSEDKNGNRVLESAPTEDLNGNGTLDNGEDANGNGRLDINEDVNGNGELDPRDPALIDEDPSNLPTVIGGEITTDGNGVGFFSMAYPQSNALWFDVEINARVQALGTESVATYHTGLSVIASDIEDLAVQPPNHTSPYGGVDLDNLPVCERP
ncbi:hypothetical protein AB833_04780 [Chromatiales bacterium (ex Bugula neritina AB1)]|nr:hypothetical protein AB833_04780 [Chromatiales bacterium (ex Bugula neritina AB1)]